ncbi:MAG: Spore coat polysaccharide biosynthesis protein spsL [Candidatus Curtissbacteria bacterium GW2011_GWA1_40_24]|uniref:Spore coat polysaccharide biosynthesis protein spsL n=1 Tax=Candidatus Curtissbacteria bacterium GW2011_GWA1_40_24 TaxID=1618406 RepID=A0A0G0RPC5_9BACT|nr:MAG: Spore coat polysaccharide biosynthesis protein spsL [Candidatus Curtissbacteria bacterium GW2011_GWA1_40_24]
MDYINLEKSKNLIEGVVLRALIVHQDDSGTLVETLRRDWNDVFDEKGLNFAMQYLSITPSGLIRDEDKWHVHKKQKDRFICISGKIVTALYDPREGSKTKDQTNLFLMGPEKEEEMYMIVIPQDVYHGFMVVSKEPGYLLNFSTQLYTGEDEGRVENSQLDWRQIANDFGL